MLAHKERGTGPAVILLHGFPLDGSIWEQQMNRLAEKYRVIVPDLPGHGASVPVSGVTIDWMAGEVRELMIHLQVGQAAVAGHSMGGYVALELKKQAPERVCGLALISTQAGDDTPEAREGRYALAEKVGREGADVVAQGVVPKLFAADEPSSPTQNAIANLIRRTPREGIQGALHAMAQREDMRPHLPLIKVPKLVLVGQEDRLIPPERSETMAAQLPNATLVKVAGAGHMPMLEQPEAVSDALERWLRLVY